MLISDFRDNDDNDLPAGKKGVCTCCVATSCTFGQSYRRRRFNSAHPPQLGEWAMADAPIPAPPPLDVAPVAQVPKAPVAAPVIPGTLPQPPGMAGPGPNLGLPLPPPPGLPSGTLPGMPPGMPGLPLLLPPGMPGMPHGLPGLPGLPPGMPGLPPGLPPLPGLLPGLGHLPPLVLVRPPGPDKPMEKRKDPPRRKDVWPVFVGNISFDTTEEEVGERWTFAKSVLFLAIFQYVPTVESSFRLESHS